MPKKTLSVAEIKAKLSQNIRDVEKGEPILVTRHGKPVAALVRAEDLETLERLRAAGPQSGLASIAGGWEGSEELARIVGGSGRAGERDPLDLD